MAVYKIFPYQDTTLYSMYPTMNTGIDPINQISNLNFAVDSSPSVARTLIQFDNDEINDVIGNIIGDPTNFETRLRSYIATAQGIVESSILEVWPIASSTSNVGWNQGTGTYLDQPLTTDGACWESPFFAGGDAWPILNEPNISGSYNLSYAAQGGGAWYTGSTSYNFRGPSGEALISSTFGPRSDKDLNIIVDDIIQAWTSLELPNYGFLLKWEGSAEFNTSKLVQPVMQYYSVDTNTIYPPELEFRWDDSSWITSSDTPVLDQQNIYISLAENPGIFYSESINRFRLNVREKYPKREYVTGSLYTKQHYLPSASAWYAVKDLDTNEFVVDFDTNYTKISADTTSSYFDLYMNGFEPERYYQVLIKVDAGGSTTIYNDEYYFKVING